VALDPLTAKLLTKAAVDLATDGEKRKRLLILILAPVIGLLLLIAFIVYIIPSPLSLMMGWLLPNEVCVVEAFQQEYGYNQGIGIYDQDYINGSGIDYGEITFTDGATAVVYFNQLDVKYANEPYGTDKIGTHGCGPTALAIVISSLTGQTVYPQAVDPVSMAEWSVANGGWCAGNGSYHSLIPNAAEAFGLTVEGDVQDTPQAIVDALASGKLVIAIMGKGHFTSSGHFIVLRGVTADGKILVADPASKTRSEQAWDFDIILNEARNGAAAGGAFWIISNGTGTVLK
jgi:hypothetical protein